VSNILHFSLAYRARRALERTADLRVVSDPQPSPINRTGLTATALSPSGEVVLASASRATDADAAFESAWHSY